MYTYLYRHKYVHIYRDIYLPPARGAERSSRLLLGGFAVVLKCRLKALVFGTDFSSALSLLLLTLVRVRVNQF